MRQRGKRGEENYKSSTKSQKIQDRLQLEYNIKDKDIKKSTQHDKRAHVDNVTIKVEAAAEIAETSTICRLTKHLCSHTQTSTSNVKDK